MFVGFAVAVLIFVPSTTTRTGVLVVSGLAAVLLIADDRWAVSPGIKFAFQLLVALVAGGGVGFVVMYFGVAGLGGYGSTEVEGLGWFGIPMSLVCLFGSWSHV